MSRETPVHREALDRGHGRLRREGNSRIERRNLKEGNTGKQVRNERTKEKREAFGRRVTKTPGWSGGTPGSVALWAPVWGQQAAQHGEGGGG